MTVLQWVAVGFLCAVLGLYILLPVGMGVAAVWPARTQVDLPPAGFSDVTFGTDDGKTLAAWYKAPENGAVILVAHGAGGSRDDVRGYAEVLAAHGYGVLAVDLRGHGESTGKTNRLGWQGTTDVRAAVDFLKAQGVERVGGLGLSMGGEVLLGAASAVPEISAITADGATRRGTAELLALPSERSLWRSFTARLTYAATSLLSGEPEPLPLLESMTSSRGTRFLLIAAGTNEFEVRFNQFFADTLGDRAELWIVPNARHTGAFALDPQEYEERLIAFFSATLVGVGLRPGM